MNSLQLAVLSKQSAVDSGQSTVLSSQSTEEPVMETKESIVTETQPVLNTQVEEAQLTLEIEDKIENIDMGTFVQTEEQQEAEKSNVSNEIVVEEKEVIIESVEATEKIQNEISVATEEVKTSIEEVPANPSMQQPLAKPEIFKEEPEEVVIKKKKKKTKTKKKKKQRKNKKTGNENPAELPIEYVASTEKTMRTSHVEEVDQVQAIQTGMMIIEEVMVKQASFQMESRSSSTPVPKEFNTSPEVKSNSNLQKNMPWPNQPALANNRSTQSTRDVVNSKSTVFTSQYFEELKTNYSQNVNDEGNVFIVSEMQYSPGDYKVDNNLASRLNQLVTILRNNPTIDLEIRCHTESVGDDQENLMLSELRAHTVRNFLIQNGISESRLAYRGYGESELLNNCVNEVDCNPQQHQENQRVEIKILKY